MWKLIFENPYYTEIFAKSMLVFIPVCLVIVGIVLFKITILGTRFFIQVMSYLFTVPKWIDKK